MFLGAAETIVCDSLFFFVSRLLFVFFYAIGDPNTMKLPSVTQAMQGEGGAKACFHWKILNLGLLKSLEMHLKLLKNDEK